MYTIIKTSISKDEKKIYSIYRYKSCVDEEAGKYAVTYGISATNTYECSRVNDATRNEDSALELLGAVSENSVSVEKLKTFIIDYLNDNKQN